MSKDDLKKALRIEVDAEAWQNQRSCVRLGFTSLLMEDKNLAESIAALK